MVIKIPKKVTNNFQGVVLFSDLYAQTKACYNQEIVLDFEETKLFESNLFAVLSCLIAFWERRRNKIRFTGMQDSIQNLFNIKKLENKHAQKRIWKCLVKSQCFTSADEELLSDYLENKIFPNRPEITTNPQLKMAIELCVAETFRNAFVHSDCKEVFIAHFFSVYNNKLFISIVDQGKTIRDIARTDEGKILNGVDAIDWAVHDGTSSKSEKQKGIGLNTIRQFIEQNQGKIQIVSGNGVWKQVKHRSFSKTYERSFPGTIITLEFNLG
ncbi:ATP-binding protein [Ancylomarina longa]|uniref:ATP-binding protein n=1 Tax=Ancylomarina longa TaxID=2487017 RepID=A0A434AVG6_9BACT|nr:ATP-binding protein [Ancylomarina longa]RUT78450.1 ATP-binding protein [Ancylomarina longa]